jgi:hypothetical protein
VDTCKATTLCDKRWVGNNKPNAALSLVSYPEGKQKRFMTALDIPPARRSEMPNGGVTNWGLSRDYPNRTCYTSCIKRLRRDPTYTRSLLSCKQSHHEVGRGAEEPEDCWVSFIVRAQYLPTYRLTQPQCCHESATPYPQDGCSL